jgi:hypothetical protein
VDVGATPSPGTIFIVYGRVLYGKSSSALTAYNKYFNEKS